MLRSKTNHRGFELRGFFDMGHLLQIRGRMRFGMGLVCVLAGLLMVILPVGVSTARGQDGDSGQVEPWWAVVANDHAVVRCGSSERFYYRVGKLKTGSLVRVIEVNAELGWAKIAGTEGLHGLVNVKNVNISTDGKEAVVLKDGTGFYPNEDEPENFWKQFKITAGMKLVVVSTIDKNGESFVAVSLPSGVPVSIPVSYLRRATDEEVRDWQAHLAGVKVEADTDVKDVVTPDIHNDNKKPNIEIEPEANQAAGENANEDATAVVTEGAKELEQADETTGDMTEEAVKEPVDSDDGEIEVEDAETGNENLQVETAEDETPHGEVPEENEPDATPDHEGEKVEASGEVESTQEKSSSRFTGMNFDELEVWYEKLKKTPILQAEIEPILEGYRHVAADTTETKTHRRTAEVRVRLLAIRLKAQASRQRMAAALAAANQSIANLSAERELLEQSGMVMNRWHGRLELSGVFDGKRLPRLYRLRDVITGRTIAYIRAEEAVELRPFLQEEVTLTGTRMTDPALGVVVLDEARVVEDGRGV